MSPGSRSVGRLAAPLLLVLAACSDGRSPTAPMAEPSLDAAVQAKPAAQTASIENVALQSSQLDLGGDPVTYTVSIVNPGKSIMKGMMLGGRLIQGGASRDAGTFALQCDGFAEGVLPTGPCTATAAATASNTAGGEGDLATGSATLEISLVQAAGKRGKVLDTHEQAVDLVAPPRFENLVLPATELTLDVVYETYTVTMVNPTGADLTGVVVQGWIEQGAARRAAGGFTPFCPPASIGTLPQGQCAGAGAYVASNGSLGTGTLVPGPAAYVLTLVQGSDVLASTSVPVTLVGPQPSISSFILEGTDFVIDGAGVGYTITLENETGADLTGVVVQAEIHQGDASNPAGGRNVCAAFDGILPVGGCTFAWQVSAQTLFMPFVPGPATLRMHLIQGSTILDTWTESITLIAAP